MLNRLIEIPSLSSGSLDLSGHLLNISVNVFVNFEAMLSPTNDAHILAQLLQLLQASQVITQTLYIVAAAAGQPGDHNKLVMTSQA